MIQEILHHLFYRIKVRKFLFLQCPLAVHLFLSMGSRGKTTFKNSKDKPTAVLEGDKFELGTPIHKRKRQKRNNLEEPKDIICLDTPT